MLQYKALPFEDKMYFFTLAQLNSPSGDNFQSYYLLVDPCMVRDAANNICKQCMAGSYFIPHDTANNNCTWKSRLTPGQGIDSATMSIKPCADSNCVNCVDNYQTCTECDTANGYILVDNKCSNNQQVFLTV